MAALRALVRDLDAANARGASLADVVALARGLRIRAGLTVDLAATRALGQAMVVLRPLPSRAILTGLTPREREVATLVASGCSNKEIGRQLGLTLGTVKHYVHCILDKTGLPGRVALAQAMTSAAGTPAIFG